jgi:hypothetical protein
MTTTHALDHMSTDTDVEGDFVVTAHCECGEEFDAVTELLARAAHHTHQHREANNDGRPWAAHDERRACCETPIDQYHADDCQAPGVVRQNEVDPVKHAHAAVEHANETIRALSHGDTYVGAADPRHPTVDELPATDIALPTAMDAQQFKTWLDQDGDLFVVYLPARKSFVIKVPHEHNTFFVAMMQQVRLVLGPEVQAVRMSVVTGPPADVDASTGTGKAEDVPPGFPRPDIRPAAPKPVHRNGQPRCPGSGKPADQVRGQSRGWQRGTCQHCEREYKLTYEGHVRVHPAHPGDPAGLPQQGETLAPDTNHGGDRIPGRYA